MPIDCTAKAIIHRIAGIRKLGNPTASTTVEESDSSDGKSPAPKLAKAPGKKLVVSSVKKNDGLKVKKSPAPTTTKKRGADQMDDPTITFDYDAAAATIEETRKRLGMRKKIKVEEGTIAEVEDRDEDAEKESVGAGEE